MIIRTRFAQSHIKKEKTEIKRIINVLRKLIFSLRKVLKNESLSKNNPVKNFNPSQAGSTEKVWFLNRIRFPWTVVVLSKNPKINPVK